MFKVRTLFEITYKLPNGKTQSQQVAGAIMEEVLAEFRMYIYSVERIFPEIVCIRSCRTSVLVRET